MTPDQLDAINEEHARQFTGVRRDETVALFRREGPAVAAIYRRLTDEQLARSAVVVVGGPRVTVLQLLEHAVHHYAEHGEPIAAALAG